MEVKFMAGVVKVVTGAISELFEIINKAVNPIGLLEKLLEVARKWPQK
jgi:hypothetical protein